MDTQKNCLTEMVLLSAQNMFKVIGKKIIAVYASFFFKAGPMGFMLFDKARLSVYLG